MESTISETKLQADILITLMLVVGYRLLKVGTKLCKGYKKPVIHLKLRFISKHRLKFWKHHAYLSLVQVHVVYLVFQSSPTCLKARYK